MKCTKKQRLIIIGTLLGDGYLQKVGTYNCRLRIEHSCKQKEYIYWKYNSLQNIFHHEPKFYKHRNTYRLQSVSSKMLGYIKNKFYDQNIKKLPNNLSFLKEPIVLAIWYMDDGYYNERARYIEIYIPSSFGSDTRLLHKIKEFTNIEDWKIRNLSKHSKLILYKKENLIKFCNLIKKYIVYCMNYKLVEECRI